MVLHKRGSLQSSALEAQQEPVNKKMPQEYGCLASLNPAHGCLHPHGQLGGGCKEEEAQS